MPVADTSEKRSTSDLSGKTSLEGLPLEVLENGDIVSIDGEEEVEPSEVVKQDQFLKNLMKVLKVRASKGNVKAHFLLGQLYFEQASSLFLNVCLLLNSSSIIHDIPSVKISKLPC